MLPYLKPYRDTKTNVTTLVARGMVFEDIDFAQKCISRIGYYRLSAYWYPFRTFCLLPDGDENRVRCDAFLDGTTFSTVFDFYLFDKALRLHITDALERIEIAIRALLIEVLGEHGAHAHRDPRSYGSWMLGYDKEATKNRLENFLGGLDSAFDRSKEEFAKHFRRTYKGRPPIWIAAGGWDWGNLAYTIPHFPSKALISLS